MSTAAEEDEVSDEDLAMGPQLNGDRPNKIDNDNELIILNVAAHVCMTQCQQALYCDVVDKAINHAKSCKPHNEHIFTSI